MTPLRKRAAWTPQLSVIVNRPRVEWRVDRRLRAIQRVTDLGVRRCAREHHLHGIGKYIHGRLDRWGINRLQDGLRHRKFPSLHTEGEVRNRRRTGPASQRDLRGGSQNHTRQTVAPVYDQQHLGIDCEPHERQFRSPNPPGRCERDTAPVASCGLEPDNIGRRAIPGVTVGSVVCIAVRHQQRHQQRLAFRLPVGLHTGAFLDQRQRVRVGQLRSELAHHDTR